MQNSFEINRRNWNDRAAIHVKDEAGGYRVAEFLAGADNLNDTEHEEIGDVAGLRIAHLQCHFGIDTLCLARRGASCVGLDFSPVAIAAAREMQAKTGLDASFVEGDVYDARALIDGDFDMVYVTWGAIGWLPDISRWAQVVGSLLKPGDEKLAGAFAPVMVPIEGRRRMWVLPRGFPKLPLAFSLMAAKR